MSARETAAPGTCVLLLLSIRINQEGWFVVVVRTARQQEQSCGWTDGQADCPQRHTKPNCWWCQKSGGGLSSLTCSLELRHGEHTHISLFGTDLKCLYLGPCGTM